MAPRNIWRVTGGGAYFLRQKLPLVYCHRVATIVLRY
jgi:hypothetical protein